MMKIYFLLLALMCFFSGNVSAVTPSSSGAVAKYQIPGMSQEDTDFLQQIVLTRFKLQSDAFKNYFTPKFAQLSEKLRQNIMDQSATDTTIKQIQQLAHQVRFKWKGLAQVFTDSDSLTLDNYDPQFVGQVKQIISQYAADLEKNKSALTQLKMDRRFMSAQLASMRKSPDSPEIRQIDASIAKVQSKITSLYAARMKVIWKMLMDEALPAVSY